jgi:RNase H-like domain found in reverse transcriptase
LGVTTYLSINSSYHGIRWILSQNCADGHHRPACFGSISWNEHEAHYSQAKLELYGLFWALQALHLHLIGICWLVVEMDVQFIQEMLNNPNVQPNMTINCWIAAILLFDFKLTHVPADKHKEPDGLSR